MQPSAMWKDSVPLMPQGRHSSADGRKLNGFGQKKLSTALQLEHYHTTAHHSQNTTTTQPEHYHTTAQHSYTHLLTSILLKHNGVSEMQEYSAPQLQHYHTAYHTTSPHHHTAPQIHATSKLPSLLKYTLAIFLRQFRSTHHFYDYLLNPPSSSRIVFPPCTTVLLFILRKHIVL